MPRSHALWDSNLGRQVKIAFTIAEEDSRDLEDIVGRQEIADSTGVILERSLLKERIASDSATLADILAYLK